LPTQTFSFHLMPYSWFPLRSCILAWSNCEVWRPGIVYVQVPERRNWLH
jgi:hypothetical protein